MRYKQKSPLEEIEEIEQHIERLRKNFLAIRGDARTNLNVYSKIKHFYDTQIQRLEEMRAGKLEQLSPDLNPPRVHQSSNPNLAYILESSSEFLDRDNCESGYYIGH